MKTAIDSIILRYGEPVEFTPQGGTTVFIQGSVQTPLTDELVNDFDLTMLTVFLRTQDVPAQPKKFDRIKVRGQVRSVEESYEENLGGQVLVYRVKVRG